jgi:hypothetical protein
VNMDGSIRSRSRGVDSTVVYSQSKMLLPDSMAELSQYPANLFAFIASLISSLRMKLLPF